MNRNHQGRRRRVLEVLPETLHELFQDFNPTQERQMLQFRQLKFTLLESEFLSTYIQSHPRAANRLCFDCCTFNMDDGSLEILKDCFLTAMNNGFLETIQVILKKDDIHAAWFPLVTDFCTDLCLCETCLGDNGFKKVVDTILGSGNAKYNLRILTARGNAISPRGLADATRHLAKSQVEHLHLARNGSLLNDLAQTRAFCNMLQKNKYLVELNLRWCNATKHVTQETTTMLVEMFTTSSPNTTLTIVNLDQLGQGSQNHINRSRLVTWTRRNKRLGKVLAGVQGLLRVQQENNNNQPNNNNGHNNQEQIVAASNHDESPIIRIANEISWRLILNAAMEDVDRNRSALYLLMSKAIVGQQEACPLHDKVVDIFLKLANDNSNNRNNKDTSTTRGSGGDGGGGKRARLS